MEYPCQRHVYWDDFNSQPLDNLSEIINAVVKEDLDDLIQLVDFGVHLCEVDNYGNGPLHIAVYKNNAPILDYLLSKDIKCIDNQNFKRETALMRATLDRKYELAEKLILAGADANISNYSGLTPLHLAVRDPHLAHLLIKHGADVNKRGPYDVTPLHCAVEYNSLESVCMLLYYNADTNVIIDMNNYTPFMVALKNKNVEIQEALFEYMDDYNGTTVNGLSVLRLALLSDSPFAEEMITRGADVNDENGYGNETFFKPLEYAGNPGDINMNTMKLVWDRMNYDPTDETSILGRLCMVEKPLFHEVIDIFISSNKLDVIAKSVIRADDFTSFIGKCREHNVSLEKFSVLCSVLLMHGYCPKETDLDLVYCQWGHCEIFEVLTHLHIRQMFSSIDLENIPSKIIYDVRFSTNILLKKLTDIIEQKSYGTDNALTTIMFRVLDNFVYPPLINAYLKLQRDDCVTQRIMGLPKVPSLLQLSRDKTRDHIKRSYNVKTSSELYTLINNLNIPDVCKKILTFKARMYRPTLKQKDFELYFAKLLKIERNNPYMHPLFKDSIKSVVVM